MPKAFDLGNPRIMTSREALEVEALHEIGRLLDAYRQRGIYDRTVTAFTSDHGESLGEHGEMSHGLFIYDATLKVPFVVAGPGDRRLLKFFKMASRRVLFLVVDAGRGPQGDWARELQGPSGVQLVDAVTSAAIDASG